MTDLEVFFKGKQIMKVKDCTYFPKVGEHLICGTEIYKVETMGLDTDANTVYTHVVIGDNTYRYLRIPKKAESTIVIDYCNKSPTHEHNVQDVKGTLYCIHCSKKFWKCAKQ